MNIRILEKNVINTWGDKGRKWLNNLSDIVTDLSIHWQLTDVIPFNNVSYNYVASAKQNNLPVVLKVSCDQALIDDEYKALKHFNGNGSIKVIDRSENYNALLLECAIPGYLLKENHPENIKEIIKIYTDVVKKLATNPKPAIKYTQIEKWCDAIDRINDQRIDLKYIIKAKKLCAYLLSSMNNEYLCHGDLHLENIICNDRTWLSIDPKGILGEMAFEAAAFDLLDQSDWDEPSTISDKIKARISLLADNLCLSKDRLEAWFFLRAMISAQWFIEDHGDPAEVLKLASILYPMLMK